MLQNHENRKFTRMEWKCYKKIKNESVTKKFRLK